MRTSMVRQGGSVVVFTLLSALQYLLGVAGESQVGVNFPARVSRNGLDITQLHLHGISRVRIYNTDLVMLRSLAHTNIEVIVGVCNNEIAELAESEENSHAWVKHNILRHTPAVKITAIAVGREVLTEAESLAEALVLAMKNIHAALVSAKLEKEIKVSTPNSVRILKSYFPPSACSFLEPHPTGLRAILKFLSETGAPFMLNLHPFYLDQVSLQVVSPDYYLFKKNSGVDDAKTGLHYDNYLDATIDSAISAMEALNHSNIPIIVTDSTWPSRDVTSQTYKLNLQDHVRNHPGTPMRPGAEIDIYITDFFNTPMHHLTLDAVDLVDSRPRARKLATLTWCVAKPNLDNSAYQGALDWVCGPLSGQGNVNCGPIQDGNSCYLPNTYQAHASWAFNSYYQSHGSTAQSCDFQGTAETTSTDPSTSTCAYQGSTNGTVNGTNSAPHVFQSQPLLQVSTAVILITYLLTGHVF